ncbi:hypothetical protein KBX37_30915 [Micromonospora sp. U56]|uniref:hypothetical protein n=1 Tax=Micromonospora sp. U56 TaxID=2824900 RepID=UPI001B3721F0|nr:hypothetical protein [Micromonospora sp. U56]MBQ0897426.1 hypothetical protein [Micromonospora sp. U56]
MDPTSMPSPELLSHYPRIPRIPLEEWAAGSLALIAGSFDDELSARLTQFSAINNAALIFTYLDDPKLAKKLCEMELAWLASKSMDAAAAGSSSQLLHLAIDPWVNQGRLLALARSTSEALDCFGRVFSLTQGEDVWLGSCSITSFEWKEIERLHPGLRSTAYSVYIIESLKALSMAGDSAGVLAFLDRQRWAEGTELEKFVIEGRLNGLSQLGLHQEVMELAEEAAPDFDYFHQAVFALHSAESGYVLGVNNARRVACGLASLLCGGAFEGIPKTTMLRFVLRLGELLERLTEPDAALVTYVKGLESATTVNDQPAQWEFLRALLRLPVAHCLYTEWTQQLCRIIGTTDYGRVRRAEGLAPNRIDERPVYVDLRRAVIGFLGGVASTVPPT